MNNLNSIVPYKNLGQYAVNKAGAVEVISDPLYDRRTYTSGTTQQIFFADQRGQGGRTFGDTNMSAPGAIPAPQSFLIDAISIDFLPSIDPGRSAVGEDPDFLNDIWALASAKAWLKLEIGEKPQLIQAPLMKFPSPYRLDVAPAIASTTAAMEHVIDYTTLSGAPFRVVPMLLPQSQNFSVTLDFDGGVTVVNDVDIQINLHGTKYRAVQ